MSGDYLYYKVTGGAVMAAKERFVARRSAEFEKRQELAKEFGASGTYADRDTVVGLVFEEGETPPSDWVKVPRESKVWKPNPRTKEGKALKAKFNLPLSDLRQFQTEVLGTFDYFRFMDGLTVRWMGYETIGDTLVLLVPKRTENDSWTPPDEQCVLLKTSEYWALKEQHQDEKAKA